MGNTGSIIRKFGIGALVLVAALIAGKKDVLLAKLRGVSPEAASVIESKAAKDLIDKVAPGAKSSTPATAVRDPNTPAVFSLPSLRKALKTTITGQSDASPAPEPPAGVLEKVVYDAPLGKNPAYVTKVVPGPKRPAMIWIHGGFGWGISELAWEPGERDNDQSGAAFYKAGIAQMFPALRGGSQSPGQSECFLGEVDDILAAAEFMAKRPDVDPARIYLGGHSTGAVLVLLAVESSARFRAAFAFGPVADARQYGDSGCIEMDAPESEWKPRAPIEFLSEIVTPTFVIEGSGGNAAVFPMMKERTGSAPVHYVKVSGANHFNVIAPASELLAKAILADTGPSPAFDAVTGDAIRAAMKGGAP